MHILKHRSEHIPSFYLSQSGFKYWIQWDKMVSNIFGTPVILPQMLPFVHPLLYSVYPLPPLQLSSWKQNKDFKCISSIKFQEIYMLLYAFRYTLFIRNQISTHKVASVSWPTVPMNLERQLFDNFIYIFSYFIFEFENSIWIKIYSCKVRTSKMRERYP